MWYEKKTTEIELATNNQPGNVKSRKKLNLLEAKYLYWKIIKRDQCKDQEETRSLKKIQITK